MKIQDAITIGIVGLIGVGLFKLMGGWQGVKGFQTLFGSPADPTPAPALTPEIVKEAIESGGKVQIEQVDAPPGISPLGLIIPPIGVSEIIQHQIARTTPTTTKTVISKEGTAKIEQIKGNGKTIDIKTFPHHEAGKTSRYQAGSVPSYGAQRTSAIEKYGKIGGR